MGSIDDQTFRVNFSDEGVKKLRDIVKDKLKQFMGDYTDDTLVEYVIVLLRNGRRKEEARNELNVFLGDDSDSFVSWLWEHLSSNLNLYVHNEESHTNKMVKMKPTLGGQGDSPQLDPESERGKPNKLSRSRHNREWKGLARNAAETPLLQTSEVDNVYLEEKPGPEVSHSKKTPPPRVQKKRIRPDERQHTKREVMGQPTIAASRLLQFAVRDAVGTTRPSSSGREPQLKRLRSVVSTSSADSELVERARRIRSVATVPNPLATVIKAVAEAAEDVIRVKSTGSVFDRLGRGMDVSEMADHHTGLPEAVVVDREYENFDRVQEQTGSAYVKRHEYSGQYVGDMRMIESDCGLPFDSMTHDEGYDDVNHMGYRVSDVLQSGPSGGNKSEDSLMLQYGVAKNVDDVMQIPRNKDHDQSVSGVNASPKTANISVNVTSWKPLHFQEPRDVRELDSRKSIQEIEARSGKSGVQLTKENSNPSTVGNGNAIPVADIQKESQKVLPSASGIYPAGRPSVDADSRTIFLTNVHFAATKDSLSRHFNKFGEVLKVVIVTDATTGQPTGSAYVEFMRKEAADNALSLDGTSFMSRILKVVKRNAAYQDAAPLMTWPRVARGSPYAPSRFTRASFPRGIPGAFRPRLPIKPGARSLQWKRDARATPAESGSQVPGNSVLSPTARSLTYVRTEPKSDGNSGTT
ncbi:uncharacterized protein LOC123212723 isoform X2 [Mangifera indica]|uniref:uncharacterized protein LOC123212723 isoform X2 n=1 Tax=Mangifera indica TaxID=29780 RepID=UPI001CFC3E79|nr:uncharacterized protein LOC123212723 isoform X2 [Mangifera indica]